MVYINKEMQKAQIVPLHFSPVGDRSKQNHFKAKENFTSSIVDPVFDRLPPALATPREANILGLVRVTKGIVAPDVAAVVANKETLLRQSAQALTDHLDGRITSFFRQIIDCYDTPYAYEVGTVEDQLESSKKITWKTNDERLEGELKFQAAHNGTIPCLIAYPLADYTAWEARGKTGLKPQGQVYQKYSDTYCFGNACEGLLVVINDVDSKFDWKTKVEYQDGQMRTFRDFAKLTLNASAKKKVDPFSGMRLFIGTLRGTLEQLSASETDNCKKIIYQIYMDHLAGISEQIQDDPHSFFDMLLGVKIDEEDPRVKKLEEVIYPLRFRTLQKAGEYQSQIAAHVNAASIAILRGGKKPMLFDQAFRAKIIKQAHARSPEMGKIFRRYFSTNLEQANQLWQTSYAPARAKMEETFSLAQIDHLMSKVEKLSHNLSVDVSLLRGNLLKQLRKIHRMSQDAVAQKANEINAITRLYSERLYQQKISNFELGGKKITDSLAQLFSRVFNTHPSVFIESL